MNAPEVNPVTTPDTRRAILQNGSVAALYEQVVRRGEGNITSTGGLSVMTGAHTGRSAADKFIVADFGN